MHRHWKDIILPIIKEIKPKHIVEIGSDTGVNTLNILKYCDGNDSKLSAIDPKPSFDVNKFKKEYKEKFNFYEEISLKVLPFLEEFDVILIDGDHNWYTIYTELNTIEKLYEKNNLFPLIFFHDTAWPYHRRDLYYDPSTIPKEYLLPYENLGIIPSEKKLSKDKGMNRDFNNAIFEGGNKNGVLTGIEDYINESSLDFSFYRIPVYNGLGILFLKENKRIKKIVEEKINYVDLLENVEKYYLELILSDIKDEKNKLIYNLTNEKDTLEQNIKEKNNTITNLTNKNEELSNEKNTLEQNIKENNNTITNLTNKNEELSNEKNTLEQNIKEKNNTITNLTNKNEELSNEKNTLEQNIKENNNTITNLNSAKFQLMKVNDNKDEIISNYVSENKSLLERSKILTESKEKQYNHFQTTINEQKDLINSLNKKYEILSTLNDSKDLTIQELSLENKSLNQNVLEKKNHYEKQQTINQEKINELTYEINSLKTQNALKNIELEKTFTLKNKQEEDIQDLNNIIQEQKKLIDFQQNKITKYESSNSWKITKPMRLFINKIRKNNP